MERTQNSQNNLGNKNTKLSWKTYKGKVIKNTGLGSLSLLQQIFWTQESYWVSCIASRFFNSWATREALRILDISMQKYGFPDGSKGKESACNAENLGSIPGLGRSPGEGNGSPFQYSHLENSMDRGAWWSI